MLKIRLKTIVALAAALAILCSVPTQSWCSETSEINEVLEGFGDEKVTPAGGSVEDALEGFEEESGNRQDDPLKGFDDEDSEDLSGHTGSPPEDSSLTGNTKLGTSYNFAHDNPKSGGTDWRGFSRLRAEMQLDLEMKLSESWKGLVNGKVFYDFIYALRGREGYTDQVLEHYEEEVELGEVYLQGPLFHNLDIKLGRQIVVWGKSDSIRVTDILNPLDLREPGLTDIEDLRLPVTMTKLDFYSGDWNFTGIAIHEERFNKNPEYGSDFYPGTSAPPEEERPASGGENTEYALSASGTFSGWDMAVYWARVFNDLPYMETESTAGFPRVKLKHARLTLVGAAANLAAGNWLFKSEAAYIDGFKFFSTGDDTYSRTDFLAGVEYSGFKDTAVSLEVVNRHINGFDEGMRQAPDGAIPDEFQSVVRIVRDFLNETVSVTVLASTFGGTGQEGSFQRISAAYDITDAIELTGGMIFYNSGDVDRYSNIGNNDRAFAEVKYSF